MPTVFRLCVDGVTPQGSARGVVTLVSVVSSLDALRWSWTHGRGGRGLAGWCRGGRVGCRCGRRRWWVGCSRCRSGDSRGSGRQGRGVGCGGRLSASRGGVRCGGCCRSIRSLDQAKPWGLGLDGEAAAAAGAVGSVGVAVAFGGGGAAALTFHAKAGHGRGVVPRLGREVVPVEGRGVTAVGCGVVTELVLVPAAVWANVGKVCATTAV